MTQTESTTEKRLLCPACANKAKRVNTVTLCALLSDELAQQFKTKGQSGCTSDSEGCTSIQRDAGWRFCDSTDCDAVYFSEEGDTVFTKSQLKVSVGVKEATGERPLCYCFGHSVATIKNEIQSTGQTSVLEEIRGKMKDPGCRCETENPSGTCCLGSVARGIKNAEDELSASSPAASNTDGGERFAKIGAVLSAVIASSCCWLPLLLLGIGVSGAGIASTLEAFRPMFIVVTIAFLSAAFYFTYRPRTRLAATDADCCPTPSGAGEACCDPATSKTFGVMSLNKAMLWVATVVAIAFLFFPSYVGAFIDTGDSAAITEEMNHATIAIEGMTCEGCSVVVADAIRKTPGVVVVAVDYEAGTATIGSEICCPFPQDAVLMVIKHAGYEGSVVPVP